MKNAEFFLNLGGSWYIRVKIFSRPAKITYVLESTCFPFYGPKDLEHKLRTVMTRDIIIRPEYVLSLVVPFDDREKWELATSYAANLRNVHSDYRFSLLKYKSITQRSYGKRYSYVS